MKAKTLKNIVFCTILMLLLVLTAGCTSVDNTPSITVEVDKDTMDVGESVTISGVSKGGWHNVQFFLLGQSLTYYTLLSVNTDNAYAYTFDTTGFSPGDYYVILVNPDKDNIYSLSMHGNPKTLYYYGENKGSFSSYTGKEGTDKITGYLDQYNSHDIYTTTTIHINTPLSLSFSKVDVTIIFAIIAVAILIVGVIVGTLIKLSKKGKKAKKTKRYMRLDIDEQRQTRQTNTIKRETPSYCPPQEKNSEPQRTYTSPTQSSYKKKVEDMDEETHKDRGWKLKREGKYREAIQEFGLGIEKNQKRYKCLIGKGECHLELGENQKAFDCFKTAEYNNDTNLNWHLHGIGRVYHLRKDYAQALSYYDKSIEVDPHGTAARYWKGKVLMDLGRYEEAETNLETALQHAINIHKRHDLIPTIEKDLEKVRKINKSSAKASHTVNNNYTTFDHSVHVKTESGNVNIGGVQANERGIVNRPSVGKDGDYNKTDSTSSQIANNDRTVDNSVHVNTGSGDVNIGGVQADDDGIVNRASVGNTTEEKKTKFCKYCGEEIPVEANFCKYCGGNLQ